MFIKKLIIMWDKKLKLDFQNKNSNQAKSRLKPIDVSTRVEPLNADEIPVALDKVVLLNGLPKTPSFLISLCMETQVSALQLLYNFSFGAIQSLTLINITTCKYIPRRIYLLTFQAHQIIKGIKTSFQIKVFALNNYNMIFFKFSILIFRDYNYIRYDLKSVCFKTS